MRRSYSRESYGGIRATLMLRQLLHYPNLESGAAEYHDPALAQEIRQHLQRTRDAPRLARLTSRPGRRAVWCASPDFKGR